MNPERSDAQDTLWTLIRDIRFCMLISRDASGALHARPMTTQNSRLDEDRSVWFFTSRSGEVASEVTRDSSVCVVYADPDEDRYVSLCGSAQISEDAARKKQLWSTMAKAWFPGGVDDPDLLLLRIDITDAHYWDVKQSKLVQLWQMARAAATGHPPKDLGEHGHVEMR